MIIVGIDPGLSGAVAWFEGGKLARVEDLPVVEIMVGTKKRRQMVVARLATMLNACPLHHVYLEHVGVRQGEGAVGAFSFGRGFGQIEGILGALHIPHNLVYPQAWKKALKVPADKGQARMIASRLFPEHAASFARVKDDGRAEAALIGYYGVQQ